MPRIVQITALGGPQFVTLADTPDLVPGPGEVRFRVAAFALNQADLLLMAGAHYVETALPHQLGYEASGIVDAIGEGVSRFRPGDRVSSIPCGLKPVGGEVAVIPEDFLASWPDGYTAEAAASVWMQYMTAYFPFCELSSVGAGDWVLITAASSSAGLAAMRIARKLGAGVIATTRSGTKRDALLAHGADAVIASDHEDVAARIKAITAGRGVKVVYDCIAGPFIARYADALATGARIFVYGGLSGELEIRVSILPLVRPGASITAYSLINHTNDPVSLARAREFITAALVDGSLPPPLVDRVFPFEETRAAYEYMQSGAQMGKIVVAVGAC